MTDKNGHHKADRNGTLNVTGTGRVQVAPDEAVVHLNVITDGKTAAEAGANNTRCTQAVIDAVSAQPNHGVTTSGLGVSPILSYAPGTSEGTIIGFRATNGVEVKTKIDYAGQIYDAGLQAGASESSGITFRIRDEAPHREEALRLAVKEAIKEARIVAGAAHIELLGPESIQIDSRGNRLVYRSTPLDAKSMTTPVIPEEQTVSATVQIAFRTRS